MRMNNQIPISRGSSVCSDGKVKRDGSLDAIRIFACILIVLMHSPLPSNDAGDGLLLCGLSYVTAPGIGLFFMVSGALLLKPKSSFDTFGFLKKRVVRVAVPLAFWSVVGIGLDMCGVKNAELGVLWFLYCITGLYLLTPVLVRWLDRASVREVEFYLLIWLGTLCVPFVRVFLSVNTGVESWLFYFQGYVGYYVLGAYMSRYYETGQSLLCRNKGTFAVLALMLIVGVPAVALLFDVKVDFYSLFWYLSATVALQSLLWWMVIRHYSKWWSVFAGVLASVSNLSFGIYLMHILVMRNVLWTLPWMAQMSLFVQIVVCAALTFVISMGLSWGVSKVKWINRVIGG